MQFNQRAPSLSFKDRPHSTRSMSSIVKNETNKRNNFKRSKNTARPSLKERKFSTVQHESINLQRPQTNSSSILMERKASINCVPKESIKPKKLFDNHRMKKNFSVEPRPMSTKNRLRSHSDQASSNFMSVAAKYSVNQQNVRKARPSKLELHSSLDM